MAVQELRKGDDGPFDIEQFTDSTETVNINLNTAYLNIICHVYTSPSDIKKYSRETLTGYTPLIIESATKYRGILEGAVNALMKNGDVILEIWTASTNAEISTGRYKMSSKVTIYKLVDSTTKALI